MLQAAQKYNVNDSYLGKMLKKGSSYKGKGKRSKAFTEEEEEKMTQMILERSNQGATITKDIVRQVLYEEAAVIKVNEPHRHILKQNPETGDILLETHFVNNFCYRNGLHKYFKILDDMKEKNFECVICFKKFGFKNVLVKHLKTVHKDFSGVVF